MAQHPRLPILALFVVAMVATDSVTRPTATGRMRFDLTFPQLSDATRWQRLRPPAAIGPPAANPFRLLIETSLLMFVGAPLSRQSRNPGVAQPRFMVTMRGAAVSQRPFRHTRPTGVPAWYILWAA